MLNQSNKTKNPLRIQLKVQISLVVAIIIGFIAVTGIAYSVLNNISRKSTVSNIEVSLEDVENNIVADVNNDLENGLYKIMVARKGTGSVLKSAFYEEEDFVPSSFKFLNHETYQQYYEYVEKQFINELESTSLVDIARPTSITYIAKDGAIKMSTDSSIKELTNVDEIGVGHLEFSEYDSSNPVVLIKSYQYVEKFGENVKIIFRQYNENYYYMAVYNEEAYKSQVKISLEKGIASRHMGENGFLIATDNENTVLSSPTELIDGTFNIDTTTKQSLFNYNIGNNKYYAYVTDYNGFNFIALMEKSECDSNMNTALKITILAEVIVFLVLYCIIYLAIDANVIKPLKRVNNSLDSICDGNLDEKVNEFSSNELKVLSEDINLTVDSLKDYMGKEAKRIQKELNFAKDIQRSALPTVFPESNKFDIYATMTTAKEVGGDFYDFYFVDDKHLFILIADVSGKGVPASLFMMQSKSIIKSYIEAKMPVNEALTKANETLCENNAAQMFVTAWCGILNLDTGVLQFANAGHNPPLIKHNGSFAYLKSKVNMVLAGLDGTRYTLQEIILNKDDELFLYTDGVTEATSISTKLYGEERLLELLNNSVSTSSEQVCKQVLDDVQEFTQDAEQSDDITMLAIKFLGE